MCLFSCDVCVWISVSVLMWAGACTQTHEADTTTHTQTHSVCMYACMYVCMTYVCMIFIACSCKCVHVCATACMRVHVNTHACLCACACVRACVQDFHLFLGISLEFLSRDSSWAQQTSTSRQSRFASQDYLQSHCVRARARACAHAFSCWMSCST